MNTCGLCDPLREQHHQGDPPATYSRGSSRIDYILISTSLLEAVQRSGILPYHTVFISDHRGCYVDFDAAALFGSPTAALAPEIYRGLRLQDPRIVQKY